MSKIVEIGCGEGTLMDKLNDYDIIGIDGDPDRVADINARGMKAKCQDLNNGIGEKGDLCLAIAIIEHVYNLDGLLREMHDNFKYAIVAVPNEFNMVAKVRYFMEKEHQPFFKFNHCHRYHEKEWERIFTDYGFRITKKLYVPLRRPWGLPFPLWHRGFSREIKYVLEVV